MKTVTYSWNARTNKLRHRQRHCQLTKNPTNLGLSDITVSLQSRGSGI